MAIKHQKDLTSPSSGAEDKVYGVDWEADHTIENGTITDVMLGSDVSFPVTYTVYKSGSDYYAKASPESGKTDYSGTVAHTVINNAIGGLTAARTHKEKVLLKGNFTLTGTITMDSYTILQLDGKVTLGTSANVTMLSASSETEMEIIGGTWDGNRDNQAADINGFAFTSCTNVLIKDVTLHDIDQYSPGNNGNGIQAYGGNHIHVVHCHVYECGDTAFSGSGVGVMLQECDYSLVVDSEIHDCLGGVYLYAAGSLNNYSRWNRVEGNLIYSVYRDGVSLYPQNASQYVQFNVVKGNIIIDASQDSQHDSIHCGSDNGETSHNVIVGNFCSNTGTNTYGYGIVARGPYNLIEANVIYNTYKNGIGTNKANNCLIKGNYIRGVRESGSWGIGIVDSSKTKVVGNYVQGGVSDGIRLDYIGTASSNNIIEDNIIDTPGGYGIRINSSNISSTVLKGNHIYSASSGPYLDSGTGTIWADYVNLIFTIDGAGSVITTGEKGHLEVPFACTIVGWTLLADKSGSIAIDVWKDTYTNFPPTNDDSIAGSELPTLTTAQKNQDMALSTWTTSVSAGDILAFNVDSASTVTRVTLSIWVRKTY